jgi:photosystem II protein PsbQ
MIRFQSMLTWLVALIAVVLVSCGGPTATNVAPTTYTPDQIARIQRYVPELLETRERMTRELPAKIEAKDWQEVSTFLHGPLGQTLQDMNLLSRNLLPPDQATARQLARRFFDNLVDIDQAGGIDNLSLARQQYAAALNDFDQFLELLPQPPQTAPEVPASTLEGSDAGDLAG